jgi:hypothetical protein
MKLNTLLFFLFVIIVLPVRAQDTAGVVKPSLVLKLPIINMPYQLDAAKTVNNGQVTFGSFFAGYANPSMNLTLNLSTDLYTSMHYGIDKIFKNDSKATRRQWSSGKKLGYMATLMTADFVTIYAPGFDGWAHEEYHRAVMTRFHVNSFNDMNTFPLGSELTSVNHVKDDDLVRFKSESPSDFIRMHVAGIEGEYLLIDELQKNNFYYNQNLPHELLYVLSTLNSISYVQICADPKEADPTTDELNEIELNVEQRDFTGLDFLGWTYDLFRPDEPYPNRGTHPSGVGIDRYIKTTDLTAEELKYLKKQGQLQRINLASPMLVGFRKIRLSSNGLYGNFAMHHLLTSFGNDISCIVYLMNPQAKMLFAFHSYHNYNRSYPGVEVQITDYETTLGAQHFFITPRILLGAQPDNQKFKTNKSDFLGLVECRVEHLSKSVIHPYIELSAKSAGWVAGNEFLNSSFSCRVGIMSRLNK